MTQAGNPHLLPIVLCLTHKTRYIHFSLLHAFSNFPENFVRNYVFALLYNTHHNVRSCGEIVRTGGIVLSRCNPNASRYLHPGPCSVLLDAAADKKRLVVIPTPVPASGTARGDPAKVLSGGTDTAADIPELPSNTRQNKNNVCAPLILYTSSSNYISHSLHLVDCEYQAGR